MEANPPIINTFAGLDSVFGASEAADVASLMPVIQPTAPAEVAIVESNVGKFPNLDNLQSDFDMARESMRNLLQKGEHVVDNMLAIATQTESARSFEVAGNLIKTMSEVAQDLIGLHERAIKARGKAETPAESPKAQKNVQNNIAQQTVIFQGTTTDFYDRMIPQNDDTEEAILHESTSEDQ